MIHSRARLFWGEEKGWVYCRDGKEPLSFTALSSVRHLTRYDDDDNDDG